MKKKVSDILSKFEREKGTLKKKKKKKKKRRKS